MRKHSNEKPYKCNECTFASIYSNVIKNHIRLHERERSYKREAIQYDLSYATSHEANLYSYATPRKVELVGQSNGENFLMTSGTGTKLHKCSQCTFASFHISKLESHISSHLNETDYQRQENSCASTDESRSLQNVDWDTGITSDDDYDSDYSSEQKTISTKSIIDSKSVVITILDPMHSRSYDRLLSDMKCRLERNAFQIDYDYCVINRTSAANPVTRHIVNENLSDVEDVEERNFYLDDDREFNIGSEEVLGVKRRKAFQVDHDYCVVYRTSRTYPIARSVVNSKKKCHDVKDVEEYYFVLDDERDDRESNAGSAEYGQRRHHRNPNH
ncbi:zinc finger protein [Ditylenchus destructor]|nr:zinc finger protein [Ditylenchus destructor]